MLEKLGIPKFPQYVTRYILYSSLVFFTAMLFGYYTALTHTEEALKAFAELAEELASFVTLGPVTIFLLIFFNNAIKTFLVMILGVFFGILPLFFLLINGYVLGVVAYLQTLEIGGWGVFWGLFPHGVIEIPALLIGASYGLWLGKKSYAKLNFKEPLRPHIMKAIHVFVTYLVPLFFIAAFIEVFITTFFFFSFI
mgnify:CR=1 FL=1